MLTRRLLTTSQQFLSLRARCKTLHLIRRNLMDATLDITTEKRREPSPLLPTAGGEEARPAKRMKLEKVQVQVEGSSADAEMDVALAASDTEEPADVSQSASKKKGSKKNKKKREPKLPDACSGQDVLYQEIRDLLGPSVVDEVTKRGDAFKAPFKENDQLVITIETLGSGGSGIARAPEPHPPWAIVVPKALPGEKVRVRISRWERMYSLAELIEVVENKSPWRDDTRMLSYEQQLELKRDVIVRAYKKYSKLPESSIPTISLTIGSPLQYAYRTKLTPHFERAPKYVRNSEKAKSEVKALIAEGTRPEWLLVGFEEAFSARNLDIEECPIATPVINEKYAEDRKQILKNVLTYKKGVSLMYRDSLPLSYPTPTSSIVLNSSEPSATALSEEFRHICVTDQKRGIARESVGEHGHLFEFAAGGFFQNNNSILGRLVGFVRDAIFEARHARKDEEIEDSPINHLVDTYCGAGLFAITLAPYFDKVAGIELSSQAIENATHNAQLNAQLNASIRDSISSSPSLSSPTTAPLLPTDISFRSGDAANIFASVKLDFSPDQSVVIIDPPRKGCDRPFLQQLLSFRPELVVYVSCNVHTQARDIGWILREADKEVDSGEVMKESESERRGRYEIAKLTGFDLFPQTAHVESVAVLRLVRS